MEGFKYLSNNQFVLHSVCYKLLSLAIIAVIDTAETVDFSELMITWNGWQTPFLPSFFFLPMLYTVKKLPVRA